MRKILINILLLMLFASFLFADYKSDVTNGNNEYKAGNYKVALVYYKKAYQAYPSKQLQAMIASLEKRISNTKKHMNSEDGVNWADKSMFISGNPLGLIAMSVPLHFEMNLNEGTGLGFNVSPTFFGIGEWSTFGISAGVEYNFYFQKHAPNGWFAGPGAGFTYMSASFNDPTLGKSSVAGLGFNINGHGGYRWIWDGGFLVDVTADLGYTAMSLSMDVDGSKETLPFGGIGFGLGASLGYAW